MADSPDPPSSREIHRRVLYALLEPAATLALVLGVPTQQLVELLQMALFHQVRRRGHTLQEASALLDVSVRTASRLSKLLKHNFLDAEEQHELPRRIEFMLWAEPLSEARIFQVLTDVNDPDAVTQALATLLDEGRIERQVGRTVTYAVAQPERRLVRDAWRARVDGLANLAQNVVGAVYARFFLGAAAQPSFARTLTLRVRREDLDRLPALYEKALWRELSALDAAATADADADAVAVDLSVVWAPYACLRTAPFVPPTPEDEEEQR